MTTGDDTIVRRYSEAMERRGEQIVLRRQSVTAKGNPPTLVNARLALDVAAGDTTISIDADQANGIIAAGDTIAIGTAQPLVVGANVTSRLTIDTPGFDAVSLTTPVPRAFAAGTPLVMAWRADELVWAYVQSYPTALQRDQRIEGDLNVVIAAYGVAEPLVIDELVIDGAANSIISVDRLRQRGQAVAWVVHAR